jgi:hypothetical protein
MKRATASVILSAMLLGSMSAYGEGKTVAPTAEQMKQLQDQIAAMKVEMDAMRAELQRQNAPPQGPMMGHMMQMQNHWQMMHNQSCGMYPAGCPGNTPPKK